MDWDSIFILNLTVAWSDSCTDSEGKHEVPLCYTAHRAKQPASEVQSGFRFWFV